MLKGAKKDTQTATADGTVLRKDLPGVCVHEMKNIVTRNGITTEVYRPEWNLDEGGVEHIIHVSLRPHAISAWHVHERQTDRIFVVDGSFKLVLYDDRKDSSMQGMLSVLLLNRLRPMVVSVPPGIWHGLQNLEDGPGSFINYFNRPYQYEDPDEWRLPWDTDQIPYRF